MRRRVCAKDNERVHIGNHPFNMNALKIGRGGQIDVGDKALAGHRGGYSPRCTYTMRVALYPTSGEKQVALLRMVQRRRG